MKQQLEKELPIEQENPDDWADRFFRLRAIRSWIAYNMEQAHNRQARYYNLRHRNVTYKVNDKVLYRNRVLSRGKDKFSAKLAKKFKGPFEVTKVISPLVYTIENNSGVVHPRVSVTDLKKYNPRNPEQ